MKYLEGLTAIRKRKHEKTKKWHTLIEPLMNARPVREVKNGSKSVQVSKHTKKKKGEGVLYTTVRPPPPAKKKKPGSSIIKLTSGSGNYHHVDEYLPSDVPSLHRELFLATSQYRSGNHALRNKIASILKNLHERGELTQKEYQLQINSVIG